MIALFVPIVLVAVLLVVFAVRNRSADVTLLVGVAVIVGIFAYLLVRLVQHGRMVRVVRRRLAEMIRIIESEPGVGPAEAIERAGLTAFPSGTPGPLEPRLFKVLFGDYFTGHAFRIQTPPATLRPINPLAVPFEPLPLRDDDPTFQDIFAMAAPNCEQKPSDSEKVSHRTGGWKSWWAAMSKYQKKSAQRPATPQDYVRRAKVRVWVMGIMGAVTATMFVLDSASIRFVALILLIHALVIGVVLARQAEWFGIAPAPHVFPGGVAFPPTVKGRQWWVVRRDAGVLLTHPYQTGCRIIVASGGRRRERLVSPFAADVAVAAWLSPLPGPSDEALRSWFGEDALIAPGPNGVSR